MNSSESEIVRSLLFVPADRPDMIRKAWESPADAIVIDLEDAIAPANKREARFQLARTLAESSPRDGLALVRVNSVGTEWHSEDVSALAGLIDGIVLPKFESLMALRILAEQLNAAGADRSMPVLAGIESAKGVANAIHLCRSGKALGLWGVYFGAEDFVTDMGGARTPSSTECVYARSCVVLAAKASGLHAFDQAFLDVHNVNEFQDEAAVARAMGYNGKICLHPLQVDVANLAFSPTQEEIDWAHAVLAAAEHGVGMVDGKMVDTVHVRAATRLLETATRADPAARAAQNPTL